MNNEVEEWVNVVDWTLKQREGERKSKRDLQERQIGR